MTIAAAAMQKMKAASIKKLSGVLCPGTFTFLAGALLAFNGTAMLLGCLDSIQLLNMSNPVFRFPTRHLMLFFGAAQLSGAAICLSTNKTTLSLGLAAWLATNFLVYRIDVLSMGWGHSCGFIIAPLGLSLVSTDILLSLSSFFLVVSSFTGLWIELRANRVSEFFKMSCPACGRHIKFTTGNLLRKIPCPQCQTVITLRKLEETLKMSCFFCKEHIEFPAHALGEKVPCPHCHMDITLKESTCITPI